MPLIRYLQTINAPLIELLEQAELPLSLLENTEQSIPTFPWWKLIQLAYEHTGDKALGFHIDEQQKLATLSGVMPLIKEQSCSVYDALVSFIELKNKVSSHGEFWLTKQSKGAWFIRGKSDYLAKDGLVPMEQLVFANMLRLVNEFVPKTWQPKLITIMQTDEAKIFQQYFPGAMVSIDNLYTGFYIPDQVLGTLNISISANNKSKVQGSVILPETFSECLYQALLPYRRVRLPELKQVPEIIALSERQIQRRLAKEGTSFKEVIQKIRFNTAKEWLLNGSYKITDISTALGYSSPGHFTRAFIRWTGVTPRDYRKQYQQVEFSK